MTEPYCFDIETLLNEGQPESLLVIGAGSEPAVDSYIEHKRVLGRECRVERLDRGPHVEKPSGRFDMGIVTDTLEHMEKPEAFRLLSRLRDLYTARFLVAVRVGNDRSGIKSTWNRNDLLAVGMMLVNKYDDGDRAVHLYKYDIATYKPAPRWLNADNWANPELWDKYRW